MFGLAAGDAVTDPARPEQAAVLVVVIAAVGQDDIGFLARPSDLAGDRGGVQQVQQRQKLGDVVAVAAGQRDGQRNPAGVDEQMVF